MIRPGPLASLAVLGGAGLLLAAQSLLPARLPPWLGGRADPLALSLTLAETLRQQGPLVAMIQTCPQPLRHVLDLAMLTPDRLRWTPQTRTLVIHAPRPMPEPAKAPEPGNAYKIPPPEQACSADTVSADEAAREILRRHILLPLVAAGHDDIKVKVTFAALPPTSAPTQAQD
jgi:hypothetical protein